MKAIEKHIILVGKNTYVAARIATYLCQEFGFVLDEVVPEGARSAHQNVISINSKIENVVYTSSHDFIFSLDELDLRNIIQVAHMVVTQAGEFYLKEVHNQDFLSQ